MPRPSYPVPHLRREWLAAGLLLAGRARGADIAIDAVAAPVADTGALRLVVRPPLDVGDDTLILAEVGTASSQLNDRGRGADKVAQDRVWVGTVTGFEPGDRVAFTLTTEDGRELWAGEIPVDPELAEPWVGIGFDGMRVDVDVGGAAGRAPAPPEGGEKGPPPDGGAPVPGPGGGKGRWGLLPVVFAALVGMALGALLRRRRPVLPPRPPAEPPPAREALTTVIPDELAAILAERARHGPILLVPRATSRESWARAAGTSPLVRWLEQDRPASSRVRRARRELRALGPVTLVVDGLDALEPPEDDEAADAVLSELVEDGDGEIVLVEPAGEG